MGSSLVHVLANIMKTKLENKEIKPLMNNGTVKFYCQYVVSYNVSFITCCETTRL